MVVSMQMSVLFSVVIFAVVTVVLVHLILSMSHACDVAAAVEPYSDDKAFEPVYVLHHRTAYGVPMYTFNEQDYISRTVRDGHMFDKDVCVKLAELYVPGTDFFDMGANIGCMTLGLNKLNRITGSVHAFEAQFAACAVLPYNLHSIGDVRIYNAAVADVDGRLLTTARDRDVHTAFSEDNVGGTSMVPPPRHGTALKGALVPTMRIDSHLVDMFPRRVSLIKMDIEGGELFALRGMLELVARDKPALLVELWSEDYRRRFEEVLLPLGYERDGHITPDDYVYTPTKSSIVE